jgi:hypothetical protein
MFTKFANLKVRQPPAKIKRGSFRKTAAAARPLGGVFQIRLHFIIGVPPVQTYSVISC